VGGHVTDSFTFTVTDNHGGTASATATIAVNVPAEPPVTPNYVQVTQDDATLTVAVANGVLSNVTHDADDAIHIANTGTLRARWAARWCWRRTAATPMTRTRSRTWRRAGRHAAARQLHLYGDRWPRRHLDRAGEHHGERAGGAVGVSQERPAQVTQDDATLTVGVANGVLVGVTHDVDDPIHVANAGPLLPRWAARWCWRRRQLHL